VLRVERRAFVVDRVVTVRPWPPAG
jgi:hypothetical protein